MNRKVMRLAASVICFGSAMAIGTSAFAQFGQGQRPNGGNPAQGGQANRPAPPRNFNKELTELARKLGDQLNIRIAVDPGLFVAAEPKAPADLSSPLRVMDALVGKDQNAGWRRVYVNQSSGSAIPAPAALAESVRSLEKLETSGIVLENVATGRASTLIKNYAVTNTFESDLKKSNYSSAIYVIYSKKATFSGNATDMMSQYMAAMSQMSPEQMAEGMQAMMQNPQAMMQMMQNMQAGAMQMFQNMSPEQRQQMMQNMRGAFGGGMGGPPPGFGGRPGGGGRPPQR